MKHSACNMRLRCTARKCCEKKTPTRPPALTATPPTTSKNRAKDSAKLAITKNCGNCHQGSLKSYTETYHGQVNKLGYAYTAKCFDCHGSHGIQRVDNPKSTMHPDNRLKTCQKVPRRGNARVHDVRAARHDR